MPENRSQRGRGHAYVRLAQKLAAYTALQAVSIDIDSGVRIERGQRIQGSRIRADRHHREPSLRLFVQTRTGEVHRKLLFETVQDDVENAVQVLMLTGGPGDPVQEIQALELRAERPLGVLAFGDVRGNAEHRIRPAEPLRSGAFTER